MSLCSAEEILFLRLICCACTAALYGQKYWAKSFPLRYSTINCECYYSKGKPFRIHRVVTLSAESKDLQTSCDNNISTSVVILEHHGMDLHEWGAPVGVKCRCPGTFFHIVYRVEQSCCRVRCSRYSYEGARQAATAHQPLTASQPKTSRFCSEATLSVHLWVIVKINIQVCNMQHVLILPLQLWQS